MPNAHALLSPSAAHRWIHCTPSVRLEEGVQDQGSDFAAEGTLAHAIASRKILETLGRPHDEQDKEIEELRERYYSEEMEGYTDTYRSIVLEKFNEAKTRSKDAQLLVEVRLDFSAFLPDAFGTADAVIIADDLMEVIDFKYGKGVKVDADHNPQMMIYALGALDEFLLDYDIKRVRMTIVQPRIDNLSECGMMVGELTAWRTVSLKPAAEAAFAGTGDQVPGEWCQFCKVRSVCTALAEKARQVCNEDFREARLISDEDIPGLLPLLPVLKGWLEDFASHALQRALDGATIKGYKLVEGKSNRQITDSDALLGALLVKGFQRDVLLKKPELRPIGELEKIVGKKAFAEIGKPWLVKPQGKPTLAEESDKRPVWKPKESADEDFNETTE
jgi:RecB family exonuclease